MISFVLYIVGAAVIILWGIAHIIPTGKVVAGFGDISADNRRIITMEWLAEGIVLCFLGVLVLILTLFGYSADEAGKITIRCVAGMLLVMAVLTLLTGAKTKIIPIKICPVIKTASAALLLIGSLV